jgi:hypothetical protein
MEATKKRAAGIGDSEELIALGIIEPGGGGGRSTSYRLKKFVEQKTPGSE